ncbi:hypothetical protein [Clostridium cochlearium]|uniref:hypothetical protein n=1 Tax=Clostridium cochlearium TaxID=1494 RepID=UPI000DF106E9|nr:hypothetical protein [Clostridium cochlearium]STA92080.1 Uncharacterised protein [Clostridium cochlearium]
MDNKEELLEKILREVQDIKVILQENCDDSSTSCLEEETVKNKTLMFSFAKRTNSYINYLYYLIKLKIF